MTAALITGLVFTVFLLVITAYFLMGSVPLLILKHDTPMDARFVRAFYDTYYRMATACAGVTAVSYALAGRPLFASGAALLAISSALLRRQFLPRMDALRAQIEGSDITAIPAFRRMHLVAILMNVAQLVFIVWSLIAASMAMRV